MRDIELFMAINNLKQKNLADFLGVGQPRISQYIKEERIQYDKMNMILNNNNGWDVSMFNKSGPSFDGTDESVHSGGDGPTNFFEIIKNIIDDYQTRLTVKDEAIVKLVSSVISQNEKLNFTLEKVFEKMYNN